MRVYKWIIALTLVLSLATTAHARDDRLAQANEAHARGDFKTVVSLYEAIREAKHPRDPQFYQNLGTAYLAIQDHARAYAAYRLALELRPRDPAVRALLADLRVQLNLNDAPDKKREGPWYERTLTHFKQGTLPGIDRLTPSEWGALLSTIYLLSSIIFMLQMVPRLKPLGKVNRLLIPLALVLAVLVGPKLYREAVDTSAILVSPQAPLLSAFVSGHEIATLPSGTTLLILSHESFSKDTSTPETWTLVETETGMRGWIYNAELWPLAL